MVFKNVLRNKSLSEIKENCTLDGRSYCDVLTCYNFLYGIPGRPIGKFTIKSFPTCDLIKDFLKYFEGKDHLFSSFFFLCGERL